MKKIFFPEYMGYIVLSVLFVLSFLPISTYFEIDITISMSFWKLIMKKDFFSIGYNLIKLMIESYFISVFINLGYLGFKKILEKEQ